MYQYREIIINQMEKYSQCTRKEMCGGFIDPHKFLKGMLIALEKELKTISEYMINQSS